MKTTEGLLRYSELDSARFGLRIFRVELTRPEDVASALAEAQGLEAALLLIRCPCARIDVAQALEHRGAQLMDTLVRYTLEVRDAVPASPRSALVRAFSPGDLPALQEVARSAFTNYLGHYHADPRLDSSKATEGYVEWLERLTQASDVSVLVADWHSQPAGFLALRRGSAAAPARIELNAVAPTAQRHGLYDALVKAALHDCVAHDDRRLEVSTQLSNPAPQNVWMRNGLVLQDSHYTFHYWLA